MDSQNHAKLQWVMVGGELHHVSDFALLAPKERPPAFCPVCAEPVTMKLGFIKAHHCAHGPDAVCMTTQPESALHLNCKFHIYRELQQATALIIKEPCTRYCGRHRYLAWRQDWDAVEVEYTLGQARPDIALLKNGAVIGAIEVFVTHGVTPEKSDYLAALSIPWLQVQGKESLYSGDEAWTAAKPLPFRTTYPLAWICDECIERQRREKAEQEYRRVNYDLPYAARIVDFYFPSGKKYRDLFKMVKHVRNGKTIAISLQNGKKQKLTWQRAPITDASLKALHDAYEAALEKRVSQHKAIVDSPMAWDKDKLPNLFLDHWSVFSDEFYPRRYVWWEQEKKWFKPKANADITWHDPQANYARYQANEGDSW